MSRWKRVLAVLGVVVVVAGCEDQQAQNDVQALKDSLNPWLQEVHEWHGQLQRAICQLEADVYDLTNSGGDTRAAGPPTDPGSNRLCPPEGPGDPPVRPPPEPPVL